MVKQLLDRRLPRSFYERDSVTEVARNLVGTLLCTYKDDELTVGRITETEAYSGRNDKACHANNNLRTPRTEAMYGPPGHAYVYLCYGIHHLFNVVTNRKGLADAVLIRSIEPVHGVRIIANRRNVKRVEPNTVNGPGKLTRALGIDLNDNRTDLTGEELWISEDRSVFIGDIDTSKRIGVDYSGEDAHKLWRFTQDGNKWLSR